MAKTTKDKIINTRIEDEHRRLFQEICKAQHTTPSSEIYKFILKYINKHKNLTNAKLQQHKAKNN